MNGSSQRQRHSSRGGAQGAIRDRDIRLPLENWLLDLHRDEPDTAILHELEIPRPSARVDLAAVNGRLAGYEIKSEADHLRRLQRQVPSFSLIFERMTLVTTAKHAKVVAAHLPDWWEILVWSPDGFKRKRRGRLNRAVDTQRLLHVLTRHELRGVEILTRGRCGAQARKKIDLIQEIIDTSRRPALIAAVRQVLKQRR